MNLIEVIEAYRASFPSRIAKETVPGTVAHLELPDTCAVRFSMVLFSLRVFFLSQTLCHFK